MSNRSINEILEAGFAPLQGESVEMWEALREARDVLVDIQALVDTQAEDEGIWFVADTGPEAYLQAALRKLHATIEERALLKKWGEE